MPMVEITTTKGALDDAAKQTLAAKLSTLVLELEAAPIDFGGDERMQALSWCFINEQQVYLGGQVHSKPIYRVTVTVPDGAPGLIGPMAERGRKQLVERVTAAVLEAEGSENTIVEAHRVWIHLRTIADGHWAAFGEVLTVIDLARYGLSETKPGSRTDRLREAALESVGAVIPG